MPCCVDVTGYLKWGESVKARLAVDYMMMPGHDGRTMLPRLLVSMTLALMTRSSSVTATAEADVLSGLYVLPPISTILNEALASGLNNTTAWDGDIASLFSSLDVKIIVPRPNTRLMGQNVPIMVRSTSILDLIAPVLLLTMIRWILIHKSYRHKQGLMALFLVNKLSLPCQGFANL